MRTLIALTVCLLAAVPQAWAVGMDLKPSQIFAADSPSIVVVVAYGQDGKAIAQGSGVVIAKDSVVSNCHVIEKAAIARVVCRNKNLPATLRYEDVERDLCSFTVRGLSAPPVQLGSTAQVKVGDAAYAIGAPEGLDLTLSGGLISSLRQIPGGVVLQMTTPISPGSSGGGLFDSEGRLIGITSYYMAKGEQLNFALPVEWVRELPQHGKLASTSTKRATHVTNAVQKSSLQDGVRAVLAGHYAAAFVIFKPLAIRGDADAQALLGAMYHDGQGVPRDYAQALAWFRKAAAQGEAEAQTSLGFMYANGQGVPQDYAQALAWYRKAAAQGDAKAQNNLGFMYAQGQGVPQDYAQALAWFRKAAAQGEAEAQNNLGLMYAQGQGVPQDYVAAYALFNLSATLDSSSDNPAATNRSKLMNSMTPEQVTAGQALTREMQRVGVIKALDEYLDGGTR